MRYHKLGSTGLDVSAIGLTWIATHHPYTAATIAGVFLILMVLSIRWIVHQLKRMWSRRPDWLRSQSTT